MVQPGQREGLWGLRLLGAGEPILALGGSLPERRGAAREGGPWAGMEDLALEKEDAPACPPFPGWRTCGVTPPGQRGGLVLGGRLVLGGSGAGLLSLARGPCLPACLPASRPFLGAGLARPASLPLARSLRGCRARMGLPPGLLLLAASWPFWLLGSYLESAAGAPSEELLFKAWAAQNSKEYGLEEYQQRLRIFLRNKRRIDKHNAGNHTFQMGLNQFSDLTFAEFRKRFLWQEPQNCSATRGNFVRRTGPYPSAIDWRKKGNYVTPVKNQGSCGSCWTFSTTGCLESAIAIATGKLLELSEQQLVDCAQAFNNHGCSGGLPSQAFEYILYNGGLMEEDAYPYRGMNGTCKFQPGKAAAFVKDVVNITLYDEQSMVEAVGKHNPVSFAFQVTEDFMHYKEGVYSNDQCDKTPDKVNHAVLAVGYGEEEKGLPYWIVKNSWGAFWGMNGYFLIERGKNTCGLADCASFLVPRV